MKTGDILFFPDKAQKLVRTLYNVTRGEYQSAWSEICASAGLEFDRNKPHHLEFPSEDVMQIVRDGIVLAANTDKQTMKAVAMRIAKLEAMSNMRDEVVGFLVRFYFPEIHQFTHSLDTKSGKIIVGSHIGEDPN